METMTRTVLLAAVLCLGLFSQSVQAAGCAAPINARQANQDVRIARGVANGELTLIESARLSARQNHIEHVEQRYRRNDGHLGPAERCDLNRRLNGASGQIYRQKHDRQRYR